MHKDVENRTNWYIVRPTESSSEREREERERQRETERERERERGRERRKIWTECFDLSMQTAFL